MPTIIIAYWRVWGDGAPHWRTLDYWPDHADSFWLLDADEVRFY
jgi:hypothetical protein